MTLDMCLLAPAWTICLILLGSRRLGLLFMEQDGSYQQQGTGWEELQGPKTGPHLLLSWMILNWLHNPSVPGCGVQETRFDALDLDLASEFHMQMETGRREG